MYRDLDILSQHCVVVNVRIVAGEDDRVVTLPQTSNDASGREDVRSFGAMATLRCFNAYPKKTKRARLIVSADAR